ncbi:hypothetical protein H0X10_02340 [Candidatus Saccharibacteria bacterium]|nr:hypothetical protein [Candidatus Saccharibacteria bacterium]
MEHAILDQPVVDEEPLEGALHLIDKGLGDMLHRELVSTDEVTDLLLDVRMILAGARITLPA